MIQARKRSLFVEKGRRECFERKVGEMEQGKLFFDGVVARVKDFWGVVGHWEFLVYIIFPVPDQALCYQ